MNHEQQDLIELGTVRAGTSGKLFSLVEAKDGAHLPSGLIGD